MQSIKDIKILSVGRSVETASHFAERAEAWDFMRACEKRGDLPGWPYRTHLNGKEALAVRWVTKTPPKNPEI